jgi:FdhD protein
MLLKIRRFQKEEQRQAKCLAFPSKIPGITGIILAGGESRRMKSDKSLLPLYGVRFVDHVYRVMDELFQEVMIVTNSPKLYKDVDCRKVPDIYRAQGALAGIHAGLCHAQHDRVFVVACDMPFISPQVVRTICTSDWSEDVVIPVLPKGFEPLHAIYGKNCIPAIEEQLEAGRKRIISFLPRVKVRELGSEYWQWVDPEGNSFRNINTPEEYFRLWGESASLYQAAKGQSIDC